MKFSASAQRDQEKAETAEKPKDEHEPSKGKGWRKAVEEDGSQVSDLSESTDDVEEGSLGERSEDYENFERMLRNKHSKACKAMSVCASA